MAVHTIYALVFTEEIKNVIVCDDYAMANSIAKDTYGIEAFAVECTQYPVAIGDRYHDGYFWRIDSTGAEKKILQIPTVEDKVSMNTMEISFNRVTIKEVFELLKTIANTSAIVFTPASCLVELYGRDYVDSDYNLNAIPNIGNLRTIILQIYGTGPASN